jgi:GDP-L-fucose synthase
MYVTVTGGNGFLGKHLVSELKAHGHDVFAPTRAQFDLTTHSGRHRLLVASTGTDAIIHAAAAVGGIGANIAEPGRFFYQNLIMGAELMELACLHNVPKFVTIGTTCEYGEKAPVPFREEHIWDGHPDPATAPYGLAKRALLEMGIAYRDQYGFNSIHLLPTNLYGPGDNFNLGTSHVIPALIRKFHEAQGGEVTLWGRPSITRDFLYVGDAARAIRIALEAYDEPEPMNIGSGYETTILHVASLIDAILGLKSHILWDSKMPEGVQRRVLDTSRARDMGFTATTSLPAGLKKTIAWYVERGPGLLN